MKCFTIILVLLVLYSISCVETEDINVNGYYWRDFFGVISSDALPGGIDSKGNRIFIGQIFHDGRLSPAQIFENDTKAYYGWDGSVHAGTQDVKILCATDADRFVWVPTKHDEIHFLVNQHIVLGGRHPTKTMYIGRVRSGSELLVGKVSTEVGGNLGLYTMKNGNEVNFHEFEILTYKKSQPVPVVE